MIRVALRQFRVEGVVCLVALVALAIALAVTGPHLAHLGDAFQRACEASRDCATAPNPFFGVDAMLQNGLPLLVTTAPALVGVFFGAPLVARELETGTFRLAWTQSVTRRRWLAMKLGVVGLTCMVVVGLLTEMVDWWASPLDVVDKSRFDPSMFGWHGVAPIGYAAFAFALGVTAGVILRRTLPAMASTLVGFVAARLAVERWIRPNLASPFHKSLSLLHTGFGTLQLSAPPGTSSYSLAPPVQTIPNDWVLSTAVVDPHGHTLTGKDFLNACPVYAHFPPPSPATMQSAHQACLLRLSATYQTVVTYQPGGRFWPFQWAEAGMFVAAALALCGLTYWWLRRRHG